MEFHDILVTPPQNDLFSFPFQYSSTIETDDSKEEDKLCTISLFDIKKKSLNNLVLLSLIPPPPAPVDSSLLASIKSEENEDDPLKPLKKKSGMDDLDQDESLIDPNLTPRQKRQIRNKISARNFRIRRKVYISTLELEVLAYKSQEEDIYNMVDKVYQENMALKQQMDFLAEKMVELKMFSEESICGNEDCQTPLCTCKMADCLPRPVLPKIASTDSVVEKGNKILQLLTIRQKQEIQQQVLKEMFQKSKVQTNVNEKVSHLMENLKKIGDFESKSGKRGEKEEEYDSLIPKKMKTGSPSIGKSWTTVLRVELK